MQSPIALKRQIRIRGEPESLLADLPAVPSMARHLNPEGSIHKASIIAEQPWISQESPLCAPIPPPNDNTDGFDLPGESIRQSIECGFPPKTRAQSRK
jgi:hypothetical protein